MKKSEFTDLIRKIVAEEVKKQFPHLILEILNSGGQQKQQIPQPQPKRIIPKTGNPALDEMLERTNESISTGNQYPQHHNHQSQRQPMVMMEEPHQIIGESFSIPETEFYGSEAIEASPLPAFLQRDYKSLLKQADKKANVYRGGSNPL